MGTLTICFYDFHPHFGLLKPHASLLVVTEKNKVHMCVCERVCVCVRRYVCVSYVGLWSYIMSQIYFSIGVVLNCLINFQDFG